jgi:tetratricopeptide (TPR) repeat protein
VLFDGGGVLVLMSGASEPDFAGGDVELMFFVNKMLKLFTARSLVCVSKRLTNTACFYSKQNILFSATTKVFTEDDRKNAKESLEQVIQIESNDPNMQYERAVSFLALGRFDEAAEVFDVLHQQNPQDTTAWEYKIRAIEERGQQLMSQSDWERAIMYFNRALDLEPRRPSSHHFRYLSLVKLNRMEDALNLIEEEIEARPDVNLFLSIDAANAYMQMSEPDNAVTVCDNALDHCFDDKTKESINFKREVLKIKAYALLNLDQLEESLETIMQANAIKKDTESMTLRLHLLKELGRTEEAAKVEEVLRKAEQRKQK